MFHLISISYDKTKIFLAFYILLAYVMLLNEKHQFMNIFIGMMHET